MFELHKFLNHLPATDITDASGVVSSGKLELEFLNPKMDKVLLANLKTDPQSIESDPIDWMDRLLIWFQILPKKYSSY